MNTVQAKTLVNLTAAIASLIATAVPSTSFAVDEKILPGSICQPTSVGISATRTFYSGGSLVNFVVENPSEFTDARIHCPIVRDNKDLRWNRIWVRVNDNSTTASVKCTAANFSAFGGSSYNITQETGGSFTGLKSLRFTQPAGQYTGGAFHVFCSIPGNKTSGGPFSAIHSIRLVEVEE